MSTQTLSAPTVALATVATAAYNAQTGMMSITKATKSGTTYGQKRMTRDEFAQSQGLDKSDSTFNDAYLAHLKGLDVVAVASLEKFRQAGLVLGSVSERVGKDGLLKGGTISFSAAPKSKAKTAEETKAQMRAEIELELRKEIAEELRAELAKAKAAK